jgi:hypothetical protein
MLNYDFSVETVDTELERTAERHDVEILEGDGVEVRQLDRRQRFGSRGKGSRQTDPAKIPVDLVRCETCHAVLGSVRRIVPTA